MTAVLLDHLGRPIPSSARRPFDDVQNVARRFAARYDAAQTTDENRRHWAGADAGGPGWSNRYEVRKVLRERARYEVQNSSYASGLVRTIALNTIGSGPRLQLSGLNPRRNQAVEWAWWRFAKRIGLTEKLTTLVAARVGDGEGFGLFTRNPGLRGPVKWTLQPVECDRIHDPKAWGFDPLYLDGVRYDESGNPVTYSLLKEHPGEPTQMGRGLWESDTIAAKYVVHYFRAERPQQVRGVPEFTPALDLFALLRRFTRATISAAEAAALFAAFIRTTAAQVVPAGAPAGADFAKLEIDRGTLTMLPEGWDISQLKPEHPSTTYPMFVEKILQEIGRCLSVPFNILTCNSSGYNFSSSRLDHNLYYRGLAIEQVRIVDTILDRLFALWLEAWCVRMLGDFPREYRRYLDEHNWFWDAPESIDPQKEDESRQTRLKSGTTTLPIEYGKMGIDFESAIADGATALGVSAREYKRMIAGSLFGTAPASPVPAPSRFPARKTRARVRHRGRSLSAAKSTAKSAAKRGVALTGKVSFKANAATTGNQKKPFHIVAYNGGTLNVEAFDLPVVVEFAGLEFASQKLPILANHDNNTRAVVGQSSKVAIENGRLILAGSVIPATAAAREVIALAQGGFEWSASIGADVLETEEVETGESVVVNGREFEGPLIVARAARLYEVSFVAIGADPDASAAITAKRVNAQGGAMSFEDWLKSLGLDAATLSAEALAVLQKQYQAEHGDATERGGVEAEGDDDEDTVEGADDEEDSVQAEQDDDEDVQAARRPGLRATNRGHRRESHRDTRHGRESRRSAVHASRTRRRERPVRANAGRRSSRSGDLRAQMRASAFKIEAEISEIRRLCANHPKVLKRALAEQWSVNKVKAKLFEAGAPRAPGAIVHSPNHSDSVLEAAFSRSVGARDIDKHYGERTADIVDRQYRSGIGLQELLLQAAARHGQHFRRVEAGNLREVLRAAFTTSSLPNILSNVANRKLKEAFTAVDQSWRKIARVSSVNDFRPVDAMRLNADGQFLRVGKSGELEHGKFGEEKTTIQADTFGRVWGITRKDMINDDLRAFDQMPTLIGRNGALALCQAVWSTFMDNTAFFTLARKNLIEGTANVLGPVGLEAAVIALTTQVDEAGNTLALKPKYVVVPPQLSVTADTLYKSDYFNTGGASTKDKVPGRNTFAGEYEPVTSSYLSNGKITGNSTTKWYLTCDPADLATVEVAFLNGNESPTVETAEADFDVLGIQMRGYYDFGSSRTEWRAGVAVTGVAAVGG